MTIDELIQRLLGENQPDPQAAAYLRSPQSRPEITGRGRYQLQEPLRGRGHIERRAVPDYRMAIPNRPPVFPQDVMPQPVRREHPPTSLMAAAPSFADYANATMNLETRPASGMATPPPVWTNPVTGAGPNPTRFPGPADAPVVVGQDTNGEALLAALARARAYPEPVISAADRARAIDEERQLLRPRLGLFGSSPRRSGR